MRITTEDVKWLRIASKVTFSYNEENGSAILCEGEHYKDEISYYKEWEHEIKLNDKGKKYSAFYSVHGIHHIWGTIKRFLKAGHEIKLNWEMEKIEGHNLQKNTLYISANMVDEEIGVYHYNTFILGCEVSKIEESFIKSLEK